MNNPENPMLSPESQEAALFAAALERPASERVAFLDGACRGDAALRARLEALLAANEAADALPEPVERKPGKPLKTLKLDLADQPDETVGQKIGRYKILEKVGEGGCGVVYVAEQTEPVRRRVALKVIKLGMDTKSVVARFEAERQALAMMDHPNIAKVLDAGSTESGRPYFIMELVRGIKLTEYCDQNKLSTTERLELFIQICHAIQHAHQKGIIHRDIKPSNILVTLHDGVPVPKVIDFGIAKATEGRLTDATVYTQLHQFIGTPAYMSPEQAEMSGLDVDTRSDIYSLGVLLYELLTGRTPFDGQELMSQGIDAMRKTIREKEPSKPSTRLATLHGEELTTTAKRRSVETTKLAKLLRGDLDWIVMKCLEKDRTRRYETANGIAMDIRRHLSNEAIIARPPSRFYEFQKTVRRHKVGFAATAAVIIVLAVGIAVASWQAFRATQSKQEALAARQQAESNEKKAVAAQASEANQRQQAEANEKKAEQVAHFMQDMLKGVGPSVALGRDTKLLREILDQTAQRLEELKGQPEVEADLRRTLGMVYRDLAIYTNAEAMLQRSLKLREKAHGSNSLDVADVVFQLSEVYRLESRNEKAERGFRRALDARRQLLPGDNLQVAESLFGLAEIVRRDKSRLDESEALHREALSIREKNSGHELEIAQSLGGLAVVLKGQAAAERDMKKRSAIFNEAEICLRRALQIQESRLGEHPDTSYTMSNLGYLLSSSMGKRDEGEKYLREALAMQRKVFGDHRETASTLQFLASTVANKDEAESLQREALEMRRKVLGEGHSDTERSSDGLVKLLQDQNRYAEAETVMRASLGQLGRGGIGEDSSATASANEQPSMTPDEVAKLRKKYGDLDPRLASALARLAHTLAAQGKMKEAEPFLNEALAIEEKLPEKDRGKLVKTLRSVGAALRRAGKYPETEAFLRPALKWQIALTGSTNVEAELEPVFTSLSIALQAQNKFDEALALYEQWAKFSNDWRLSARKGDYLLNLGRDDEAADEFRKVLKAAAGDLGKYVWAYQSTLFNLCAILARQGKFAEAEAVCREELNRPGAGVDADRDRLHIVRAALVRILANAGREDEARTILLEAAKTTDANGLDWIAWDLATSPYPKARDATNAIVLAEKAASLTSRTNISILNTLGVAYAEAGQFAKAAATEKEALAIQSLGGWRGEVSRLLVLFESSMAYHDEIALEIRATLALKAGQFTEAEAAARENVRIREKLLPDRWETFNAQSVLGGTLLAQKKFAEAEPLLLSGYEGMKPRVEKIPVGKLRLKTAAERLVQLYEATGQSEKAAEWKAKLPDAAK